MSLPGHRERTHYSGHGRKQELGTHVGFTWPLSSTAERSQMLCMPCLCVTAEAPQAQWSQIFIPVPQAPQPKLFAWRDMLSLLNTQQTMLRLLLRKTPTLPSQAVHYTNDSFNRQSHTKLPVPPPPSMCRNTVTLSRHRQQHPASESCHPVTKMLALPKHRYGYRLLLLQPVLHALYPMEGEGELCKTNVRSTLQPLCLERYLN